MSKLARLAPSGGRTSVVASKSATVPDTRTYNGGAGFTRDVKSELFLLAVTNFVSERTFYETAKARDSRFTQLIHAATREDPRWTASLVRWLRDRDGASLRTVALVAAVEYGRVRSGMDVDAPTARFVLSRTIRRADEPGEVLGYWLGTYGRKLPKWFKRALGDAALFRYNEYTALKYDTSSAAIRFGDVIEFSQIDKAANRPFLTWLLDRRRDRKDVNRKAAEIGLTQVALNRKFTAMPKGEARAELLARPELLREAAMTWEQLSAFGRMDAAAWEAVIPVMPYFALLRNLRNFDQAGVHDVALTGVANRLRDQGEVLKSGILPFQFLSAYRAVLSDRWKFTIGEALDHSLGSVPVFRGKTLILVDTSSSMHAGFSKDGTLMRWDAAALFGICLARRNPTADLVSFSSNQTYTHDRPGAKTKVFEYRKGASVLAEVERWDSGGYFLGGGTDTAGAVRAHYSGHDRVVVLTDEQANRDPYGVFTGIPDRVSTYTFNLAGYRAGMAPSGTPNRHVVGGLTDAGFKMIAALEARQGGAWPWELARGSAVG